jgi:hypothetical protein
MLPVYLIAITIFDNSFSDTQFALILNILFVLTISVPLIILIKNLILSLLGNLKTKTLKDSGWYPAVSIIFKLGNDKEVNMNTINSIMELNYPIYEMILLSNNMNKYSDVEKNIIGYHISSNKSIKISLLHSAEASELNLLNTAIKISAAEYISLVKPGFSVDKNAFKISMRHFADKSVTAVIGREKQIVKTNILDRLFYINNSIDLLFNNPRQKINKSITAPESLIVFRKENLSGIEFKCVGNNISLNFQNNYSASNMVIYDTDSIVNLSSKISMGKKINKIFENELLKFDNLILQWNHLFVKSENFRSRIKLDWQIFKFIFFSIILFILNTLFFITAIAAGKYEYIIIWLVLISIMNFVKTVFSSAADFSILKFSIPSALFKWLTDIMKLALSIVLINESSLINSLYYSQLKK